LDDAAVAPAAADELLAVDEALSKRAAEDQEAASVLHRRHIGGLSIKEAAQTLGMSRDTTFRHWTFARPASGNHIWGRDDLNSLEFLSCN
jgi:DNA-directed RNA polymerase specialized sigma24 family protein